MGDNCLSSCLLPLKPHTDHRIRFASSVIWKREISYREKKRKIPTTTTRSLNYSQIPFDEQI